MKEDYSQNGEAEVLEEIFEVIGTTSKRFLEIGIEDGKECNTRNFVEDYGWFGTMVEGNIKESKRAREFYKGYCVNIVSDFVTPDNINQFISNDLDLLSIDVDGDDFWLWKAVKDKPRVVIIEYNSTYGEKSITQPFLNHPRVEHHPDWLYHGASLKALIKLGKEKGYRLFDANGVNAFFYREDIKGLPERTFAQAYKENMGRRRWGTPDEQFELIKDKEFVEI